MEQDDLFEDRHIVLKDNTWPWVSEDILFSVEEHWLDSKNQGWRNCLYMIGYYETTKESRKVIYEKAI